MVQTISADKITLFDLNQRFQLVQTTDPSFFPEWQDSLPTLTAEEKQRLERIRTIVANLEQRSVLENTIKLAVIAPLLDLSGFFYRPFMSAPRIRHTQQILQDSPKLTGCLPVKPKLINLGIVLRASIPMAGRKPKRPGKRCFQG
jgi:hypothetical protein